MEWPIMIKKDKRGDKCNKKGTATRKGRVANKAKILEYVRQLAALTSFQYSITQNLEKEVKK
jgi:hypothetical protein